MRPARRSLRFWDHHPDPSNAACPCCEETDQVFVVCNLANRVRTGVNAMVGFFIGLIHAFLGGVHSAPTPLDARDSSFAITLLRKCLRCGIYFRHKRTWFCGGRCISCGYSTRGNVSGRCPECGILLRSGVTR